MAGGYLGCQVSAHHSYGSVRIVSCRHFCIYSASKEIRVTSFYCQSIDLYFIFICQFIYLLLRYRSQFLNLHL